MDFLCTKPIGKPKQKGLLNDALFDNSRYDNAYILDICKIEEEGLNDVVEEIRQIPCHHDISTCLVSVEEGGTIHTDK